ncbi:hypothetical protein [Synechococcus sp. CC9616]|uniref:hypothetical protein n=1 Tax=Synechococcus sp. CC9616 TaxID=110663 RepID=UPI0004B23403|nr:hypothetical protein [Synechococcus sp. CC9616]
MDGEFQQRYQDAEQAFAEARHADAHEIATDLLNELDAAPKDSETQAAVIGWRAFVALLLGNIDLYGLGQPETAAQYFQLVLDSQPHDTLAELAQQGLSWAEAPQTSEKSPEPPTSQPSSPEPAALTQNLPLPDLLKDPFLAGTTTSAGSSLPAGSSAMPWLEDLAASGGTVQAPEPTSDLTTEIKFEPAPPEETPPQTSDEPEATPQPQASAEPQPTPSPTPSPTPTPAASREPASTSAPEPEPEPEPIPDPLPVTDSEPVPTPSTEPDPMEVLGDYLLRVKSSELTDSNYSEKSDPDEADQDRSTSSISQQLLDLWRRLNRR